MKSMYTRLFQRIDHVLRTPELRIYFISIFILILLSTALLYLNNTGVSYEVGIGDIANEDIKVSHDIRYVDHDATAARKSQERKSVLPVFDIDDAVLTESIARVTPLFSSLEIILQENPPLGTDDLTFQLAALKSRIPRYLHFNDSVLKTLLRYGNGRTLRTYFYRVMIRIYDKNGVGVLEKNYDDPLQLNSLSGSIRHIKKESVEEIKRPVARFRTVQDVSGAVNAEIYAAAPGLPRNVRNAFAVIVKSSIRENMKFNSDETSKRLENREKRVKPVMALLKKNQIIVREGDIITSEIMEKISIVNRQSVSGQVGFISGILFLQVIFMFIFGFFMVEFNSVLIPEMKSSFIIFTLMILYMMFAFFASKIDTLTNMKILYVMFLPTSFVTMMVSILYNRYLAILLTVYMSFFTTMMSHGGFSVAVLTFSSALLGVVFMNNVERRTDFLRGGVLIGVILSMVSLAVAMYETMPAIIMLEKIYIPLAHGLFNAILVMGFLPLFENAFGITTRFRLLELADLNAPIFKTMLVKAPGTYNHSLIVANMAETACRDINANSLLARVGAYYHDIGKVDDAGIYIENKKNGTTNNMKAHEYARAIIHHVEKGVSIAHKQGIPESVIDFIRTHHGQSVMTYFYHQALEEAQRSGGKMKVNKDDFRYPGPRPLKKETAVVLIADSVEAASRTLQEPTFVTLRDMVQKVIDTKLNDGELRYSELSMADLKKIEKSFLRILTGIFHTRIEYPEKEAVEKLESQVQKQHA